MKRACLWLWFGLCWATIGCSTPISALPQVEDEEEPDAGPAADGGADQDGGAHDAGTNDGGSNDAGPFECRVYGAATSCPSALPAAGAACSSTQIDGRCFYPGSAGGRLRVAECQQGPGGAGASWKLTPVRCTYTCQQDLPQGGNFFSVDTGGCLMRAARSCRTAQGATSQQGLDQLLHEIATRCRVPDSTRLGVSFTAQSCVDVVFYPMGPRLNPTLQQCLSSELERVRVDCDAACALSPALAP